MKVLHVIPALTGAFAGPALAVTQLCEELRNQGVAADIATTDCAVKGLSGKTIVIPGSVPAYYFGRQLNSVMPDDLALSLGLAGWMKRHIREYDLLHIHSLFTFPSTVACYYAAKYDIPYVLRPAGMLSPFCLKQSRIKKKIFMLLFEKRNLRNAAAIHFTAEDEMRDVKLGLLNTPKILLPHGLDQEKLKEAENLKGELKKRYPQIEGKKTILFLSRLHPIKGLGLLIPALKILSLKRDDFVFILSGSGSLRYEKDLKKALTDAGLKKLAIPTGFVEGKIKQELLAGADIFVLPSYHENFGMAVVEAMICRVPVIITKRVNIYGLIEEYRAGFAVDLDSQDIASKLDKLLSDSQLRLEMGNNGRRLAQEHFDIKECAQGALKMYSDIIGKSKCAG
ncbi:MAG: glycosyltransferase [Candidatus Omnitrophica bacterium]|nr:glycosyltransferase [Candidatus Omnitrophota bacterium]MDD5553087.1 glycosyltransferase [Candidatus Omnitrophota bacterium]